MAEDMTVLTNTISTILLREVATFPMDSLRKETIHISTLTI